MSAADAHLIHVLGMHRSGTSALARVVNLLGAALGDELMGPRPDDNPRGYWEHQAVQRLQQEFLQSLDRNWDDPRRLPDRVWEEPAGRALVDELSAQLERELAVHSLFALKDPRTCVLGPAWRRVQDRLGFRASAVAVIRHPRGVIDSLARRSDMPSQLSLWLWWRHNLEWMAFSRDLPRVALVFEELVADPARAVSRIRGLEAPWPQGAASMEAAASIEASTIRGTNEEAPSDVDAEWWRESLALYEGLRIGPRAGPELIEPELEARLRARMAALDPALEQLAPVLRSESRHRWALVRTARENLSLREARRAAEDARWRCASKLAAIEGSTGYKALRRLQRLKQRLRA